MLVRYRRSGFVGLATHARNVLGGPCQLLIQVGRPRRQRGRYLGCGESERSNSWQPRGDRVSRQIPRRSLVPLTVEVPPTPPIAIILGQLRLLSPLDRWPSISSLAVVSSYLYLTDIPYLCPFCRLSPPLDVSHCLALTHAVWTTSKSCPSAFTACLPARCPSFVMIPTHDVHQIWQMPVVRLRDLFIRTYAQHRWVCVLGRVASGSMCACEDKTGEKEKKADSNGDEEGEEWDSEFLAPDDGNLPP